MIDELYLPTKAVFGFMCFFDEDWEEGWRPMLDMRAVSCRKDDGRCMRDILYMSRFGSYVRQRANENVDQAAFEMLHDTCERENLEARRNRFGKHERSIDSIAK